MGEALEASLLILAPIVPHITQALWSKLGKPGWIAEAQWPTADPEALVKTSIDLVLQVNGKRRGFLSAPPDSDKSDLEAQALANSNVTKHIEGLTVRKVIVVPNKLINIVAN